MGDGEGVESETRRILVADDEKQIRLLLSEYLGGKGFEVHCVPDGLAALEALETDSFDAAVVDLSMPRMDGIEVVRRAREKNPGVAFVIITGYASDRAAIDALNAGAVRFLPKPFKLEDLLASIKSALKARGGEFTASTGTGLEVQARPNWVVVTAPSQRVTRDRLEHLFELLAGQELPRDELNDIRIALGEIVSNAVEWGNRHDLTKPVKVSYCLFPGEIVLTIEDLGMGFQPEDIPDPLSSAEAPLRVARERERQGKRPGGFGLAIARNVMDQIIYNRLGNSVVMSKRLSNRKDDQARA
jgi:DNA-binding response OmpR family regulator